MDVTNSAKRTVRRSRRTAGVCNKDVILILEEFGTSDGHATVASSDGCTSLVAVHGTVLSPVLQHRMTFWKQRTPV